MSKDLKELLEKYNIVEYTRKSTEDKDKQAFSLEDQHNSNLETIKRHNLKQPIKTLEESKSAHKEGRILFEEMLKDLEKGKYRIIVCWHINRLSRNPVDGARLISLMDKKKLLAIVTSNSIYGNSPSDKLMLAIEFGMAKKTSDDLGPTVLRGMQSKIKRGWFSGRPKPGYLNVGDASDEKVIQVVDEIRFPILQKAIKLYLTGGISVPALVDKLNNEWSYTSAPTRRNRAGGNPMSISTMHSILKNSYIYGEIFWGDVKGAMHPSLPKLVSEAEYWEIQRILGKKGVQRPKEHTYLPFRGIIKCDCCGYSFSPYIGKKTLADGSFIEYVFYRCTKKNPNIRCTNKQISLLELNRQITTLLESVSISKAFFNWAVKNIKSAYEEEANYHKSKCKKLEREIDDNKEILSNLVFLLAKKTITEDQYLIQQKNINTLIDSRSKELNKLKTTSYDWIDKTIEKFELAKDAKDRYIKATQEEKTNILNALGSNYVIKGGRLGIELHKPFSVFEKNRKVLNDDLSGIELKKDIDLEGDNNKTPTLISLWWADLDSNQEPPRYKLGATNQLSYPPG